MQVTHNVLRLALSLALAAGVGAAHAQAVPAEPGRLAQIAGEVGGGVAPWALLADGRQGGVGVYAPSSLLGSADFSYARGGSGLRGNLYPKIRGMHTAQEVSNLRLRLFGDAAQATWMPQVSAGLALRSERNAVGLAARQYGLRDEAGHDFYVSATKLLMNDALLLNGTVRIARNYATGLPGFRVERDYQPSYEASATYQFSRKWAVGAEYRYRPNGLGVDGEKSYADIYLAYFPTKNLALTLAYAPLGDLSVPSAKRQNGAYMSLQFGF